MYITLTNNFHNSTARIRVPKLPSMINQRQAARARSTLCGIKTCRCAHSPLGTRGKQYHNDRELAITPISDDKTEIVYGYPE